MLSLSVFGEMVLQCTNLVCVRERQVCLALSTDACRGVFGCHTALVLRRLRRLCEREYGSFPTFVVTSATIANPQQHVRALLGESRGRVPPDHLLEELSCAGC